MHAAHVVLALLTAGLAFAAPAQNVDTSLDRRDDGTGAIAIDSFLATQFAELFGSSPSCCEYIQAPEQCWAAKSNKTATPWELCYVPGTQVFSQKDANVVKCLANLHYVQKDSCISVEGSVCNIDNYIANGGRVQNTRLSYAGAYTQIDAAQSAAFQGGIQALVGTKTMTDQSGDNQNGAIFSAISPVNGVDEVDMYIRYIGEDAC